MKLYLPTGLKHLLIYLLRLLTEEEPRVLQAHEPISMEQNPEEMLPRRTTPDPLGFHGRPNVNELDEFEGIEEDPEDQKGKKPIEPSCSSSQRKHLSATETGQSSSASPIAPDSYCTICLEPKWQFECFHKKGCSHVFCSCCISQYVAVKIAENATWVRCPEPGCKDGILEPEMCRLILPPESFDRWGSTLCESLIGSMKFYCPYSDCSALLVDERGGTSVVIKQSECPHCLRLFCAQCRVPWHAELTCEMYQTLGADERGRDDLMLMNLARNCKWQRCPKCKYFVERIDGCLYMKCRCGFCFCYGCASEMKELHYCFKCKR